MDQDIKSQIERAESLLEELERSCRLDLEKKIVSEKTKNLTQEILTKMRYVLDQSMHRFFEKMIAPNFSSKDIRKIKVYFPITNNKNSLKAILGRGKMADLNLTHPEVYNFIDSIQPYNPEFNWLSDFVQFVNEKHIRLSPQEIKEENETILSDMVHVGGRGRVAMRGCLVNGIPVNSEDINATPLDQFDPRLQAKRIIWTSFNFEGSNINILWLCKKAVDELKKMIDSFFTKF